MFTRRSGIGVVGPLDRRRFLGAAAATGALAALPPLARAQTGARIIVVGGGFAGATVAKYLKLWGGAGLRVTLLERNAGHFSCIMSNLVLNGARALSSLHFGYEQLAGEHGVEVMRDEAIDLDVPGQRLLTAGSGWLGYDRVVLAPGISFAGPPGWDPARMPHAWVAGESTQRLADQLEQLPAGGTFVMTIPPAPYRCPPGPYERACLVADLMLRRSPGNPGRVIVLDANPRIMAEPEAFGDAFATLYAGIIDYRTGVSIAAADPQALELDTSAGIVGGDVVNLIAPHRAASLVTATGLTGSAQWAPVTPLSYASTLSGFETVHVIGDSQGTGLPKSGHMANSQAKVCADGILRSLAGSPLDTPERIASIKTNSACFSPITATEASWLTAVFAYDSASGQMQVSGMSLGEAGSWTAGNFDDMLIWSEALFADTFGRGARTPPEPFPAAPSPAAIDVPLPPWATLAVGGGLSLAALRARIVKRSQAAATSPNSPS